METRDSSFIDDVFRLINSFLEVGASMATSPAKLMLDFLAEWNLDDANATVEDWPGKQLRQLATAYNDAVEATTAASLELTLSRPDAFILAPESVRSQRILERSLLYADFVLARTMKLKFPEDTSDAGLGYIVGAAIKDVQGLQRYLRTGVVLPVIDPIVFSDDTTDQLASDLMKDSDVAGPLKELVQLARSSEATTKSENGKETTVEIERMVGRFDGLMVGGVTIPGNMTVQIFPDNISFSTEHDLVQDPELASLRDELVLRRISHLIGDLQWSRRYGSATLVASTEVAWDILRHVDHRVSLASGYPAERIIVDLNLPFLNTVNLDAVVHVRERSADALLALRQCLQETAEEIAGLDPMKRQLGIERIVEKRVAAPLRDLDHASRSALMRGFVQSLAEVGVVVGATSLAYAAGAGSGLGTAGASAALSAGLLRMGPRLIDLFSSLASEAGKRKRSPVYMLWRAGKTR